MYSVIMNAVIRFSSWRINFVSIFPPLFDCMYIVHVCLSFTVKKQIKLMTGETQDDLLHEFITVSPITEEPIEVPAKEKEVNKSVKDDPFQSAGSQPESDDTTVPNHSQGEVNHSKPTSSEGGSLPETTNEVDGFISFGNSAPSKTGQISSNVNDMSMAMSSLPVTTTPNMSILPGTR